MIYETIVVDPQPIATITLNRPEKHNALSNQLVREVTAALLDLDQNKEVVVIVIKGAGRSFCAGADLAGLVADATIMEKRRQKQDTATMFETMGKIGKIVVGQVHGYALGGGFGLTAACDLAVAAEDAVFGMPEIKRGLFPMTILPPVIRSLGRKKAVELMVLGDNITAQEALQIGLVNKVVPREQLEEATMEMARKVAAMSPTALRLGKETLFTMQDMDYFTSFRYLKDTLLITSITEDAEEGATAFLAKRAPVWQKI